MYTGLETARLTLYIRVRLCGWLNNAAVCTIKRNNPGPQLTGMATATLNTVDETGIDLAIAAVCIQLD